MSHRLQVLIPSELEDQVRKSVQRVGISTGEWVRRAPRESLSRQVSGTPQGDPVAKLAAPSGPTGDIEQLIAEIERGRF
jgi:hypothetical protein